VQVIQQLQMGTPPTPHSGFESNVAPMVLHPVISSPAATSTDISFNISPKVQAGQQVTVLLNEATMPPPAAPAAYSFSLPPVTVATSMLDFSISAVQAGTKYFIRVTVDGAESPLDMNPSSPTFGPTVTTP
jgi:hypothetical protein